MKNTIKCCISCILPCGSLDVIRIVHTNGTVEEISGTIRASEIMKAHPKHVLKIPSRPSEDQFGNVSVPKIIIVPPEAELQRGKIYFLMPLPPSMLKQEKKSTSSSRSLKKRRELHSGDRNINGINAISNTNALVNDQYLSEILSEKLSTTTHRDRASRGRVGVWRPHLERICESPSDA